MQSRGKTTTHAEHFVLFRKFILNQLERLNPFVKMVGAQVRNLFLFFHTYLPEGLLGSLSSNASSKPMAKKMSALDGLTYGFVLAGF